MLYNFWLLADGTNAILLIKQLVILLRCDSEELLKVLTTIELTSLFVCHIPIPTLLEAYLVYTYNTKINQVPS